MHWLIEYIESTAERRRKSSKWESFVFQFSFHAFTLWFISFQWLICNVCKLFVYLFFHIHWGLIYSFFCWHVYSFSNYKWNCLTWSSPGVQGVLPSMLIRYPGFDYNSLEINYSSRNFIRLMKISDRYLDGKNNATIHVKNPNRVFASVSCN